LSSNELQVVPDVIYSIKTLKRLNLSHNNLSEISSLIGELDELMTLNLSRNKLLSLPSALCKLSRLKKLYVNSNYLNFIGIPAGIGKLGELEIFSASDNRLETLPEGLCRCGKLRKLLLNKNRLYALPEAIHFLQLAELDVSDNPNFKMPPKPIEMQKAVGAGALFYNVDFSLQTQLLMAGATPQQLTDSNIITSSVPIKDPIARKKRLKLLKQSVNENESSKVLKGMRDVAETKKSTRLAFSSNNKNDANNALIRGKKWDEQLEKPKLDYSDFFDDDVGHEEGIQCFEIEKFLPNPLDQDLNGTFFDGDCYIILKTFRDNDTGSLNWKIYYWIGMHASLDKQACAAMHSVNLRNLLGATCRTIREEQYEESDEFKELFDFRIKYVEGAQASSGFYTVEDIEYITRMYKISGTQRIVLEPVPLNYKSLSLHYVYLLDAGLTIYLWNGAKANPITCSKARLFAEKINKNERKFQAELIQMKLGDEVMPFWRMLEGPPPTEELLNRVSRESSQETEIVDADEHNNSPIFR
jgi:Leucine-rich repeat (LRR) protein